ncbi:30S ribosomal protein S8 [sediment metagenome]|uniref:30S ribosomal protein S8 n=1 Tax=sediment metagenome TaxID=749907 RepID=D9PHB2_9ZZZZ
MNDKISELIINIKNASMVNQKEVIVAHSNLKEKILDLLKKEGYIEDVKVLKGDGVKKNIKITLAYELNGNSKIKDVKRISKLSKRIYYGYKDIFPVKYGHGIMILSTPLGIITDKIAKKQKVGGEALFKV